MTPKLDIKHLLVLQGLSDTGSVTETAARLGLTQSAVSHRLREAERRIGAPLMIKADGRVALTPEARRLRALSEHFLRELSALEQDIEDTFGTGKRIVRLGQATYSRYHWLPSFTDYLATAEPRLEIDLVGRATTRPFAALLEGWADVATVYGRPNTMDRLRWMKLGHDPLVAVMAPNHPLAETDLVDVDALSDERTFTYPLSAEPGFQWDAIMGSVSRPYQRVTQMPTPESVIDLLRAGYGISVFSQWAIEPELADGTLVARPLGEEALALDWWAVTRESDSDKSPAVRLARAFAAWSRKSDDALASLGFEGES